MLLQEATPSDLLDQYDVKKWLVALIFMAEQKFLMSTLIATGILNLISKGKCFIFQALTRQLCD